MNDGRGWVEKRLLAEGYSSTRLPSFQLEIERVTRPSARILCLGLAEGETFGAEDVDAWLDEAPDTEFIVVLPTKRIVHAAYERAEECGICVAGSDLR